MDAFAPPTTPHPVEEWGVLEIAKFALHRALRVVAGSMVLGVCVLLLLNDLPSAAQLASLIGVGVTLWLPSSALLFRCRFLPREPDPRLRSSSGRPLNPQDVILMGRVAAFETTLGSLPLGLIALYLPFALGWTGALLGLFVGFFVVRGPLQAWLAVEHDTARILEIVEQHHAAAAHLRKLLRWPLGNHDAYLRTLALSYFSTGALPEALEALDRIKEPGRWRVPMTQALFLLGTDLPRAHRLLKSLDPSDPDLGLLSALYDLHTGHAQAVRESAPTLLAHGRPSDARLLHLALAAAFAGEDPERARQLLRSESWGPERLPWLRRVWPPVASALEPLAPW